MKFFSSRALTISLAVCIPLLAGCPSTPLNVPAALTGYTIASTTSLAQPLGAVTAVATCPTGTVAAGGGWHTPELDTAALMRSSAPLPAGAGWTTTVSNTRVIGRPLAVQVFAVCTEPRSNYAVMSSTGTASAQSNTVVDVACPTNTDMVSGGGVSVSSADLRPFSQQINNQSSPERYRVGVRFLQIFPGSASFTAHAICADFTQWPGREVITSQALSVAPLAIRSANVSCPNGKSALHGTVVQGNNDVVVTESFPVNGGADWAATVVHPGPPGAPAASVRLQVVCASAVR